MTLEHVCQTAIRRLNESEEDETMASKEFKTKNRPLITELRGIQGGWL